MSGPDESGRTALHKFISQCGDETVLQCGTSGRPRRLTAGIGQLVIHEIATSM
jgi:hypothetical protein